MPPVGRPRPDRREHRSVRVVSRGRSSIARRPRRPNPGRVPVHRLNRAEYTNAIRDLLALEIDGPALLPADEVGHGFDNIAGTLTLSPALLERYMSAARRISRLAIGDPSIGPGFTSKIYVVPINMTQNDRMSEDLPFGSRAGLAVAAPFSARRRVPPSGSAEEERLRVRREPRGGARSRCAARRRPASQRSRLAAWQAGKPAPVELLGHLHGGGRRGLSDAGVGRLPDVGRRASER